MNSCDVELKMTLLPFKSIRDSQGRSKGGRTVPGGISFGTAEKNPASTPPALNSAAAAVGRQTRGPPQAVKVLATPVETVHCP